MSEILSNIVVQQIDAIFTPEASSINITPTDIQLNIYSAGSPGAGNSNVGELLYNSVGVPSGVPSTNYANGILSLGTTSNISISGGTNGYILQTDGTGNLTWTAQANGISGNGVPGGANTQVQYNNAGNFGGTSGFTFNSVSGNLNIPGNLVVAGNINGTVANANYANFAGQVLGNSQPNITTVGSLTGLSVITTVVAGNFSGDGYQLSNITAANITGQVGNALIAGTVYTNAQPNITSVGTLTGLNVSGNANISGISNLSGNVNITATTSIQQAIEKITSNATGATGTINYDLLDQAILFKTANATGNITLNFRGNSTTTLASMIGSNSSITCTFINTNGATPYVVNNLQIDGSNITPVWTLPGSAGTGTPSGRDVYTFNLIKTASTFTAFATRIGYV